MIGSNWFSLNCFSFIAKKLSLGIDILSLFAIEKEKDINFIRTKV